MIYQSTISISQAKLEQDDKGLRLSIVIVNGQDHTKIMGHFSSDVKITELAIGHVIWGQKHQIKLFKGRNYN